MSKKERSDRWDNVLKAVGELVKSLREKVSECIDWDAPANKYVGFLVDEDYAHYTLVAWCRQMLKLEKYELKYLAWVLGVTQEAITSAIDSRAWSDELEEAYIDYLLQDETEVCTCEKEIDDDKKRIADLENEVEGNRRLTKELLDEIEHKSYVISKLEKEIYDLKITNMMLNASNVQHNVLFSSPVNPYPYEGKSGD